LKDEIKKKIKLKNLIKQKKKTIKRIDIKHERRKKMEDGIEKKKLSWKKNQKNKNQNLID